eukprot:SAG22_NODE_3560_length_1641_cov_1.060960_1_plen_78_part_00
MNGTYDLRIPRVLDAYVYVAGWGPVRKVQNGDNQTWYDNPAWAKSMSGACMLIRPVPVNERGAKDFTVLVRPRDGRR